MNLPKNSKVLIGVLNWGIGHATRCIPLIKKLLLNGNEVSFASDGDALMVLLNQFPDLKHYHLPSYQINYSKNKFQNFKLIVQVPKLIRVIKLENKALNDIAKTQHIDFIISDNRYGFYHPKITSIFMGHQLSLIAPFANNFISKIHSILINKFNHCWVPAHLDTNIIPLLTYNKYVNIPISYIGYLSKWEGFKFDYKVEKKYKACAVISGPEPQRSIFEQQIIQLFSKNNQLNFAVVGGVFSNSNPKNFSNITYFNFLNADELWSLINLSELVISRSGYSSIMDFLITETPVIYVPTPGQSEQEYIAEQISIHGIASIITQEKILDLKFY